MISLEFTGRRSTNRMLNAGVEAEKQLAFYLDRAFREDAYDFRVFHGLRLERQGEVAQIDHLALHRYGFFLIESKSIIESVSINEHGEFARSFKGHWQGMPSPIAQAKRQAELLRSLLNDNKQQLRRVVGVGPFKQQGTFHQERFRIIAAISDKGQIKCKGKRPAELMKAEAVVDVIRSHVDYQNSLATRGAVAGSLIAEFTNRKKAREWEDNYLSSFTNGEIEKITEFLVQAHKPLADSLEATTASAALPTLTLAESPSPDQREHREQVSTSADGTTSATADERRAANTPARNMKRWTKEEEHRLRQAFATKQSPEDLAATFDRTPKALRPARREDGPHRPTCRLEVAPTKRAQSRC